MPNIIYPSGGGAAPVTPTTTTETWPADVVITTAGVTTWRAIAPDGVQWTQAGNGTNGPITVAGDVCTLALASWPVNGQWVVQGEDGGGDIVSLDNIVLGDVTAEVPGAMVLPDWDTLTESDPNGIFGTVTANSYVLENVYISVSSSTWAHRYTALAIPTGKRLRIYWIDTGGNWTQQNSWQAVFFSSDPTNPAGAAIHVCGTNRRHFTPNRGRPGVATAGGVPSDGSENTGNFAVILVPETGEDGLISTYSCFGREVNLDTLVNSRIITGGLADAGNIAFVGICGGRTAAGAAITVTGRVLVEVY